MIEESLLKSNFIGRDGFRWWIGQVAPVTVQDKQANKEGLAMDTGVFPVLLRDFTIPLLIGGGVIGLLLVKGFFSLAAPFSLLFYGLSLYNLSKNSLEEIRWLSITELVLGMLGMYIPQYSFLFWLTGFGLLHIGYGLFIYLRHNR